MEGVCLKIFYIIFSSLDLFVNPNSSKKMAHVIAEIAFKRTLLYKLIKVQQLL